MYYKHDTRRAACRLEQTPKSTDLGQRGLSCIGSKMWNDLRLILNVAAILIPLTYFQDYKVSFILKHSTVI